MYVNSERRNVMNTEYTEAVKAHSEMIYRLALAGTANVHDAEDIAQTVFMKLFRSRKKFSDAEHMKAWLIRVAVNEIRQMKRSPWFRKRDDDEIPEIPDSSDITADTENKLVYDAVMSLKQDMRIAVILHYYYDYPCADIAKMTGTKEATVRTRLRRAREQLKTILKEDHENE